MPYDFNSYHGRTGSAADVVEDLTYMVLGIAFLPCALLLALVDKVRRAA